MSQPQPQNIYQQNLDARRILLQNAPPQSKNLGTFTGGQIGGSSRIKLFNVGIITRLLLKVTCTVAATYSAAGSAPVLSPRGPYHLINRIRLTDFNNTDRINCSGDELYIVNCTRRATYAGYNNESAAAVANHPVIPAPTNTAAGQQLTFFLEVPLAFDPAVDLRGAILAQTGAGELSLNIDWNNTLFASGNADAVFNGGTNLTAMAVDSATGISVTVYQDFYMPQKVDGQVVLPGLDLITAYEISGGLKSSDNLNAGAQKLINMPNYRSVIGTYIRYVNGGVMNGASSPDITKLQLIANGNNILYERDLDAQLYEQRLYFNSDTRPGMYQIMSRRKPIETAMFGNVQIAVTPANVQAGNTYISTCLESFWMTGATLPGLQQGS